MQAHHAHRQLHISRWLISLAVALTLVLSTFGTGFAHPAASPTQVSFLVCSCNEPGTQTLVNEYNASQTAIHVTVQDVPFASIYQQIEATLGAGSTSPDALFVDAPQVAPYGFQNFLAPLNKYVTKADLAKITPASLKTSYYKGKLLSLPLNQAEEELYYNKTILKKAKIPFPSASPKHRLTWEQLTTYARKATEKKNGQTTVWGLILDQVDQPFQVLSLPESLGGKAIGGKDHLTTTGVITTKPWIKAMTWYYDLSNKWDISPKSGTAQTTAPIFASGHAAFFWGGAWQIPGFVSGKVSFGYAPMPYFAGGHPVTPDDSWHLGVNRRSPHAAAAAQFLKWLTIGPGNAKWWENNSQLPSTVAGLHTVLHSSAFAKFPNAVRRLEAYELTHTAVNRPVTAGYNQYDEVLAQAFFNIRAGELPKAALDSAAAEIDREIAQYR